VTEVPGESTLRKNFAQLQEGEGRRTPNPLFHAQAAFFPPDNIAKPRGMPPAAAARGHVGGIQQRQQQQQQQHPRQPGHQQVLMSFIIIYISRRVAR